MEKAAYVTFYTWLTGYFRVVSKREIKTYINNLKVTRSLNIEQTGKICTWNRKGDMHGTG